MIYSPKYFCHEAVLVTDISFELQLLLLSISLPTLLQAYKLQPSDSNCYDNWCWSQEYGRQYQQQNSISSVMKQNRSWEVCCGFMVWTVSNLEYKPDVLGLYMLQAGAFTYAAKGDLSALNGTGRCFTVMEYKLRGESRRLIAEEEWFKNQANRFTDSGARKAITTPHSASCVTKGWLCLTAVGKARGRFSEEQIRVKQPPPMHFQFSKLSAYQPSYPCHKVIIQRQKSNVLTKLKRNKHTCFYLLMF